MLCGSPSDLAAISRADSPRTSVDKGWSTADWKATYMPEGNYFDQTADVELVVCVNSYIYHHHNPPIQTQLYIQVEGHQLPAHKLVLALQSEVFHNSFADTACNTSGLLVLETCFVNTSIADIVLLLRYIYSLTPHEFLANVCVVVRIHV